MLGLTLLAMVFGVLVGLGGVIMGMIIAGFLFLVAAFFVPVTWVFWLLIASSFLVVGQLQYFGKINKAFWLPYLTGLLLMARIALLAIQPRQFLAGGNRQPLVTAAHVSLAIFFLSLIASSLLNTAPVFQVLVSLKEVFFLWGVWLAVRTGAVGSQEIDRLWRWALPFLVVQLPVIAYQRFYIAPNRHGPSSWDAVVGLFGGNPEGGGASGAMALCAVLVMAYELARWRKGLSSIQRTGATMIIGLLSIALAEVKFAILLIPVSVMIIFARDIMLRPLRGLAMLIGGALAATTILFAYQAQYAASHTRASASVRDYVEQTLQRNTDSDSINYRTGEIGRLSALKLWWREHGADKPVVLLLGHGIGATRIGMVTGEVSKRYSFKIARSTLAIVLWEGGLIGACALMAAILFGFLAALREAHMTSCQKASAMLQTAAATLLLVLLGFPYGTDFMNVAQVQIISLIMLAYTATQSRLAARHGRANGNIGAGRALPQ